MIDDIGGIFNLLIIIIILIILCSAALIITVQNKLTLFALVSCAILTILVLAGSCALPFSIPAAINNYRLDRFKQNLYYYPLPPNTHFIDKQAEVGLLGGDGNHCDYSAELTLVTEQCRQEIERYYADAVFPPARSNQQEVGESMPPRVYVPVKPSIEFIGTNSSGKLVYKISILDYGYDAGLDYRCH
jgi:hypothetical protein